MWFKKDRAPKEAARGRTSKVPEGLWVKCDNCRQILYNKELARNFKICPKCGFHFRLSAPERLRMLFDDEKYVEHEDESPLDGPARVPRHQEVPRPSAGRARSRSAPPTRSSSASGTMEGMPVIIGAMEFFFMAGSMGSVVGEKVARAAERALAERQPLDRRLDLGRRADAGRDPLAHADGQDLGGARPALPRAGFRTSP